jgi:threonine aldolase
MAAAAVGDDVFGEDPTVRRLEAMAAERMGKMEALFVPSGTMANLVSLLSHCRRGDEVILGDQSHIAVYEQGGSAAVGGIHPRTLANRPDGTLPLDRLEGAIRPNDPHYPRSRLVALENSHNRCSGEPLTVDYMARVGALARRTGLLLHVDGARIFNAAAALDCQPSALVSTADSVGFCLSKGLAAPVGSVICGDARFIEKARRNRKLLGGGMRQAGVIAAAGIVALEEMVDRLGEDHANAARLADGLNAIEGIEVVPSVHRTNIVYGDLSNGSWDAAAFCRALAGQGIRVLPVDTARIRAVLHYHIDAEDVEKALDGFKSVLSRPPTAGSGNP